MNKTVKNFCKNLSKIFLIKTGLLTTMLLFPIEKVQASVLWPYGTLNVQVDQSQGSLAVKLDPKDAGTISLVTTTPNMIQDAFQDMKNYLGLNILKYQEQQSRLEAIVPPNADQSKNNGSLIAYNQTFVQYWNALFTSNALIRNLFQPAGASQDSDLVFRHLTNYCSVEEATRGVCWPASTDANGNYIGAADLSFNSILAFTSYPNSTNPAAASPLQTGAIDFINNLINPEPIQLPISTFNPQLAYGLNLTSLSGDLKQSVNARGQQAWFRPTSATGDTTLASMYKQAAALSIPQQILMNMVGERTQIPGLGASLGITDTSKQNISSWEALEYEATRRYQSEDWATGINNSPSTAILREIANIAALQTAMQFRQIQQGEEIKALLAAQIGMSVQSQAQAAAAQQQQPGQ